MTGWKADSYSLTFGSVLHSFFLSIKLYFPTRSIVKIKIVNKQILFCHPTQTKNIVSKCNRYVKEGQVRLWVMRARTGSVNSVIDSSNDVIVVTKVTGPLSLVHAQWVATRP